MTARKTIIGLCMICAMLVSAIAASGASASSATAVTAGGTTFTGSTSITGESEGNSILKATTGGVTVELVSTALEGSGSMANSETGGVMEASGTGTIKYLNVSANHSCLVNGAASSSVTTNLLHAHSLSTTQLKFEPNSGTTFAEFSLSSCAISALNKTWIISGSVIGTVNGAKTEFTHEGTTGQGTLKANTSIPAGLAGILKIKGENGNGLELQ